MKNILFIVLILGTFATGAFAQQTITAEEFTRDIGKTKTLCDTVYSLKIFSDTLTLINMGGLYPNQKYTVAIRGTRVTLDWPNLKGKRLCITGVLEMYKGRREIEINDPERISVQ
jgi:hypothetical protein